VSRYTPRFQIVWVALLVLVAAVMARPPSQALAFLQKATPAPTPADKPPPPPTPTDKPPAASTPAPTKPPALPTPTIKPTVPATPVVPTPTKPSVPPTPTAMATPTSLPGSGAPTPVVIPGNGDAVGATATSIAPGNPSIARADVLNQMGLEVVAGVVTGQAFDDANGNGVQDQGEPGVPGVPVALDGHVVAATDAGGRFVVPVALEASLAVVPPQGWEWNGQPVKISGAGDVAIPLRRVVEPQAAAVQTATTVTGGVAMLAVIGVLAFVGVASLSQAAAVRALERTYRRHKTQEFELAMAREIADHTAQLQQQLKKAPDAWRDMFAQLVANAGLGRVLFSYTEVSTEPCVHFGATGSDGRLYVFTTDPAPLRKRGDRVMLLDANLSLFARVNAYVLWMHLAHKIGNPTVPDDAAWYLIVCPPRKPALLSGRRTIISAIVSKLRGSR
jgi:hypothetical protein